MVGMMSLYNTVKLYENPLSEEHIVYEYYHTDYNQKCYWFIDIWYG